MEKDNKRQEILEKMLEIAELVQIDKNEETKITDINYYKDFNFKGSNLAENDIFVVKIENADKNINTYEIYSGKTNNLIATVDEQGKVHFRPEYIESLKEINPQLAQMLNLEDLDFELPQELQPEDMTLPTEERTKILSDNKEKTKEKGQKNKQENKKELQKNPEDEKREEIAKFKNIPPNNVLVIRENSNLYKDHPELEENLYFYRDNNGVVKAEYIDEKGEPKPSRYFEPSTTSLREETISLGDDGNPVTREVPYQVMRTRNLNSVDKDIRDIRISVNIDSYGYLELQEARQGKNGEWLSHDIEVKGRDYNSYAVNQTTSIKTRKADPDKQTEAYEKAEGTGLEEDGIQYSEMYLIEHADEVVEDLMKEGYQKKEAVQIVDYMLGEEALTLEEAKEKTNEDIIKEQKDKEKDKEVEEGRTPWGDAEERLRI